MNFTTFKAKYSVLNECFLKRELFVLLTKIHELELQFNSNKFKTNEV